MDQPRRQVCQGYQGQLGASVAQLGTARRCKLLPLLLLRDQGCHLMRCRALGQASSTLPRVMPARYGSGSYGRRKYRECQGFPSSIGRPATQAQKRCLEFSLICCSWQPGSALYSQSLILTRLGDCCFLGVSAYADSQRAH